MQQLTAGKKGTACTKERNKKPLTNQETHLLVQVLTWMTTCRLILKAVLLLFSFSRPVTVSRGTGCCPLGAKTPTFLMYIKTLFEAFLSSNHKKQRLNLEGPGVVQNGKTCFFRIFRVISAPWPLLLFFV